MTTPPLAQIAAAMVANGKGLLAADESSGTIKKRFADINLESTEENRRKYREMLFTAQGIEQHISGVILFDETLRQTTGENKPFPQLLNELGIIPGIKVDKGLIPLTQDSEEKITQGLDDLGARLDEYYALGARFAKWRAVYSITENLPSRAAITQNAFGLARYASLCQQHNLVPIVEPEVLMDGTHDIEACARVTESVLYEVFHHLFEHNVVLEQMILKPNMIISGKDCTQQASPETIAEYTLTIFRRTVPAAVPGIMFLSGGQSDEVATANLAAINQQPGRPWPLSFSYGRALQAPALRAWMGKDENIPAAQNALAFRSKMNSQAALGTYQAEMENVA